MKFLYDIHRIRIPSFQKLTPNQVKLCLQRRSRFDYVGHNPFNIEKHTRKRKIVDS